MTINSHQRKMRSRTWGASLGGCSCAPIPADRQDEAQPRFVGQPQATSLALLPLTWPDAFAIPGHRAIFIHRIARDGARTLTAAEHGRAGRRLILAGRRVTKIVRAVMAARRQQILRIELEPAKQSADPFHLVGLSSSVGFNANRHRRGHIQNAGIPFQERA